MKFKLFFLVGLAGYVAIGQGMPQVTPPTPEAASLAKYVESPVSHYTGTPNISIPIYTISTDGVEVPISLSYHSKGIQVAEIASKVGTGWALNAGGIITRQVRGTVDEYVHGFLRSNYVVEFFQSATKRSQVLNDAANDYDPDLYFFNCLNFSGKFIIDHVTKKPIVQSFEDIKIDIEFGYNSSVEKFKITDSNGTKYFFNTKERLVSKEKLKYTASPPLFSTLGNDPNGCDTAWYLSKIVTVTNDIIIFNYTPETVYYCSVDGISSRAQSTIMYSRSHAYQNQLSSIEFKDGSVEFINDITTRQDLQSGKAIKNIVIKNKIGETIMNYNLDYFYTNSPVDNSTLPDILARDPQSAYRLFLNSVSQTANNVNQSYTFEYNPIVLPNRHSNKKDNWGYYNGSANHYAAVFFNANRNIDSTYAEAGMLKKINYPTGGYTKYEYEQNKVLPPLFYTDLLIPFDIPSVAGNFGLIMNDSLYTGGKYKKQLVISGNLMANLTVDVQFALTGNCLNNGISHKDCMYKIYISRSGQIIKELHYGITKFNLPPGIYEVEVVPKAGHISPNPGASSPLFNAYLEQSFWVDIDYVQKTFDLYSNLPVGGKRIRRILKGEGDTIHLEKTYSYNREDGKSSGRMHCLPPYYYIVENHGNALGIVGENLEGAAPMANYTGSEIGYSKVSEVETGTGNNGRTEYTFTNFDNGGEYYRVPFHFPIDFSFTRGKALEVKYYNFKNNLYNLVKEVKNKYRYFENNIIAAGGNYQWLSDYVDDPDNQVFYSITGYQATFPMPRVGKFAHDWSEWYNIAPFAEDDYRMSYFVGGRVNLEESEEVNYFDSGNVTTKTAFSHSSPTHNRLKSQSVTTSDGQVRRTTYAYPHDTDPLITAGAVRDSLIAKNMFVPLITRTFLEPKKLSEQRTIYKDWGGGLLAPEKVQASKGGGTLEDRVIFTEVDPANGNPLQVQLANGSPVSYLWGYNKNSPIAKIENASYAQIAAALSISVATLKNYNETNLTAINTLRTLLPNAMITTYTYDQLIGVESITDPKGQKLVYFYDEFNRLKSVKDRVAPHVDNILTEYEYHYRTQN